jgi:hypothetical protein
MREYEANPFFRAKLNYLLKTTPSVNDGLPYEQRLTDLPLQTYKHCTRTDSQEFDIKLQEIALIIGDTRRA